MATCMVCFEGGPPTLYCGVCKCREHAVHAACLERLIAVPSHRMKCAVCHTSYAPFVTEHSRTHWTLSPVAEVVTAIALHTLCAACVVGLWRVTRETVYGSIVLILQVMTIGMLTAGIVTSVGLLVGRVGVFGCVRRRNALTYSIAFEKLQRVDEEAGRV